MKIRRSGFFLRISVGCLAGMGLLANVSPCDIIVHPFSEPAVKAMREGRDAATFSIPLVHHMPAAGYDEVRKKARIEPIVGWLVHRSRNASPLSPHAFSDLTGLLLDPAHQWRGARGKFRGGKRPVAGIEFRIGEGSGYLVLSFSKVRMFWAGGCHVAVLNAAGVEKLTIWFKANGLPTVPPDN